MTTVRSLVADRVRIPFRRPFATATGMWVEREAWILRLVDADGRVGLGEAVLEPANGEVAETILAALVREAVEGAAGGLPSLADLEMHGAPGRALAAALEGARFDLEQPVPVEGDVADGVGVNATLPSLGPGAAAEAAQQSVESGFVTLKIKAGAERETEALVERVRTIRAAVGPDIRLRLDVNGAWDLATATDRLEAIERFDIEFVEQPLAGHDIDGLAELRRRVRVPIAADEAAASVRDVRGLLEAEAVDVVVVKPARVGGADAVAEIAAMAAGRGVPVVVSTLFETGIGIAAALAIAEALPDVASARWPDPLDHGLATAGLLEHDLLARSLVVEDGRMRAPGRGRLRRARGRARPAGARTVPGRCRGVALVRAAPGLAASLAVSARVAAADPGRASRPAVADGTVRWTWSELDRRADAVAAGLAATGVVPGDRVIVLAAPSAAVVAALHGIARAGAVAAPLGSGLTRPEIAAAAKVLRARVAVVGAGVDDVVDGLEVRVLDLARLVGGDADAGVWTPAGPAAPAVAILTSGTTGRPKAAVLSTAALIASAESWLAALPPATGWLLAVGLGHVAGIGVVWRAALAGVPLVVLERPGPATVVAALAGDPVPSHVSLVPTTLARILDATGDAPPPSTLRAVPLGGGPIPASLVRRALAAGWPVVPTYGLTEAGSGVTALPSSDAADHPDSAGPALPGVQIRIAAPDDGGIGEIEVRSAALFDGYLDDPDATTAAMTDDGWLRTGDLGRLDDEGRLTVADRRTDRIVRGGENIAPSEIEAVLLEHPAVADVGCRRTTRCDVRSGARGRDRACPRCRGSR